MKYLQYYIYSLTLIVLVLTSCDKIEQPYEKIAKINVDTTLYTAGTWSEYIENEYPVFSTNPNTEANVLIEDYTGHKCITCPEAAAEAHSIQQNNPERVFVASIHTGPGNLSFQKNFPEDTAYYTDHTNPEGIAYGEEFADGFGFSGNPQGTINRKEGQGGMFALIGAWQSRADNIMLNNNLRVNIQSEFNYFSDVNGGFLHVEIEKKTSEAIEMNTVVYVIQDSLVDWQKMPDNSDNEFYVHRDKHLGSIDNNPFGVTAFAADAEAGEKRVLDYSYVLPAELDKTNMHFLIYVYNVETYEIFQVIKQTVI